MPEFDVVIKDGMIFDGLRNPRWRGDVAVKDGVIVEMGRVRASDATRVIDASSMHVAPGFIDVHTHYDAQVFWDPYLSTSGWHGVTSVLMGNCGFGFAPVAAEQRDAAMLSMVRAEAIGLEAMQLGLPWDWETYPEFLDSVERTPKALNVLGLVPTSPLLIWAMGYERAKAGELPTDDEHAKLRRILWEAMDAGAAGFSARRLGQARDYDGTPIAGDVMRDETIYELTGVLSECNAGTMEYFYAGRTAEEADPNVGLRQVFRERQGKIRSHLEKVASISGQPLMAFTVGADDLEWFHECQQRGMRIYPQGTHIPVPERFILCFADEGTLTDQSPAWSSVSVGPLEQRIARMSDPEVVVRMRKEASALEGTIGRVEDWVIGQGYSSTTRDVQGMSIADIAAKSGSTDPVSTLASLLLADGLRTKLSVPAGAKQTEDLDEIRTKIQNATTVPGISDGGAHTKVASMACFTTQHITDFVREREWISLEDMHWKLSAFGAHCVGIRNRGTLTVGAMADIVVYDYDNLAVEPDEIQHDLPGGDWRIVSRANGYQNVLVNGQITIEDDKQTGAVTAGRLLRHGGIGRA